ncbi:hypothetical protein ACFX13_033252 [Malus domestica]
MKHSRCSHPRESVTPKSFLTLLGHGGFAALHLAPVLLVLLGSLAFLALGFDEALHRETERVREMRLAAREGYWARLHWTGGRE